MRPSIEEREAALHQAAIERVGRDDFGDPDYRAGLRVILQALDDDPDNEALAAAVEHHAVDALAGRLHSEAGWQADPACLDIPVTAPLIITGAPRTGTSMLHQLMCVDEQFQWMPHWLTMTPQKRQSRSRWADIPEFAAADHRLDAVFKASPLARAAHNSEAALPEECIRIMVQSFVTMRFISSLPLPRYEAWFLEQDETPSYRRLADNLRLIGGHCAKPWLLKNPSHAMGIDALLAVFPDARIVVTHRGPFASISSGASMVQRSAGSVWRDPRTIGPHRLRTWARAARRLEEARQARPHQFVEIAYDRLLSDPIGATDEIYAHFGMDRSPAARAASLGWLSANPQGKHGSHDYSLEATGLTTEMIAAAFEDYNARYGYTA